MAAVSGFDEIDGVLSEELGSRVKAELEPGERLLWAGSAHQRQFGPSAAFLAWSYVAAILAIVGTLSWAQIVRNPLREIGGLLFLGLLLGVFDVFLVLGLLANWNFRRTERAHLAMTLYALTDRRAIIWTPQSAPGAVKVVTIPRGSVRGVHRVEFPDGSGDIVFNPGDSGFLHGNDYGTPTGFLSVAEVRRVEEQVRRTLVVPTSETGVTPRRESGEAF